MLVLTKDWSLREKEGCAHRLLESVPYKTRRCRKYRQRVKTTVA